MNILVTFASRHGSTRAIAETIAAELEARGHHTVYLEISNVETLDGFDAVVAGSGVYLGRWRAPAPAFHAPLHLDRATPPTSRLSSRANGEQAAAEPQDVTARRDQIRLVEHRSFAGSLELASLGLGERLMSRIVGSAEGDFRDWGEIRAWARDIANALAPAETSAAV
jgi:menaquinone-dependent protoporphyrinogen oxidase